jgi:hypothetical protein
LQFCLIRHSIGNELETPPPGLKPGIYTPERSRGLESPLPGTKVRGWHDQAVARYEHDVDDVKTVPLAEFSLGVKPVPFTSNEAEFGRENQPAGAKAPEYFRAERPD